MRVVIKMKKQIYKKNILGRYTNMYRYYSLLKITSIMFVIVGAIISFPVKDLLDFRGWLGIIITLSGIILFIIAEEEQEKLK
jgi:FtsH-binding integral membrane protein